MERVNANEHNHRVDDHHPPEDNHLAPPKIVGDEKSEHEVKKENHIDDTEEHDRLLRGNKEHEKACDDDPHFDQLLLQDAHCKEKARLK